MKKLLTFIWVLAVTMSVQAQFSGSGSGTADDPYLITTEDDLFDVRNNLSAHYKLMNDLDLTEWIAEESPKQGWDPISTFTGVFDGNGKTISGLTISRSTLSDIGLFGATTNANIKDLCLNMPSVEGNADVGALVGKATNTSFSNITLISPYVKGSSSDVGSLAGSYSGTIDGNTKIYNPTVEGGSIVGGLVGISSSSNAIENVELVNPHVTGGEYTGGLIGYASLHSINNNIIKNPKIQGGNRTGGIVGYWKANTSNYNNSNSINNNILLGGKIEGDTYVGGVVADIDAYDRAPQKDYYVLKNYISSIIIGSNIAAGICGHFKGYKAISDTRIEGIYPHVLFNRYDGKLSGVKVGGVVGWWQPEFQPASTMVYMGTYEQNIVTGEINGDQLANGIIAVCIATSDGGQAIPTNINLPYTIEATIKNNIVCAGLISNLNDIPNRIGGVGRYGLNNTDGNYGLTTTVFMSKGEVVEIEDGGGNGTSYGTRTLKRKNTYIGFGYDFENNWAMVEGKHYPYNITQSVPPTITTFTTGSNARIAGTASGSGKVYVFVNDEMIEDVVVNGQWNVSLGTIGDDDVVRVSVETDGKKPSIVVNATEGEYGGGDDTEYVDISLTNEYATLCSTESLDFTNVEGVKAYIAAGYHDGIVMLMRSDIVPAGEGVLLHGTVGSYSVPITDRKIYYSNLLRGVTETTTIEPTDGGYTNFILTRGSTGIGFYPVSTSGPLAAGKAYLQLPTEAFENVNNARLSWMFDDAEVTGINEVDFSGYDDCYYTLDGKRLDMKPSKKGVYLYRGKKVVVSK